MNYEFLEEIENKLGYTFKNKDLLLQAFVRSSYSNENPGWKNNEVLEFMGDKALDIVIVGFCDERYRCTDNPDDLIEINERRAAHGAPHRFAWYKSFKTEGELTDIKISLVESKRLAAVTEKMGFNKHLLMGKGDAQNSVAEQNHVKEDLFESIIGAVAIDSCWNIDIIKKVVFATLNPTAILDSGDFGFDYVGWVETWWKDNGKAGLPEFQVNVPKYADSRTEEYIDCSISFSFDGCSYEVIGHGWTEREAISDTAKRVYNTIVWKNETYKSICSIIGEPSIDKAVNQLQELWQKGKIEQPQYTFFDNGDNSGNNWECECSIPGTYIALRIGGQNKMDAKKNAAYEVLLDLIRSNFGQLSLDVTWQ